MPWHTPTLRDVRSNVRDYVRASLPGADANIPNSVLRVMSDSQGALCHLTLQYLDWLALQLLPDTAETEWLDRHGQIWLVNSDGSNGRKMATLSSGTALFTGLNGTTVPTGTQLTYTNIGYETTAEVIIGVTESSEGPIRALDPGTIGNQLPGTVLSCVYPGVNTASVVTLDFGADEETDEQLRARVLRRIRQPPMGGAAYDYEAWALAVPGVTRAWAAQEMGIGTVTTRFMMDDLRASNGGFPLPVDLEAVAAYIDTKRPVAVKDIFTEGPIPYPINHRITFLDRDNETTRAAIEASLVEQFFWKAVPGQGWFRSWSDEGIANAVGVNAYDLILSDASMPAPGYMAVLGDISYG
jgi:uncharacterized phage protein gp47/JayE